MQTLRVALAERSYPIYVGKGLLGRADLVVPFLARKKVAVVTNATVAELFLERLAGTLAGVGVETVRVVVADGEEYKDWRTLNSIFDHLLNHRCGRDTTLIALGGGVIGDLAGFAAATYQRGVPLVQIPTTLLAQADSSVGGKTAINHPLGKNMIGAFHQPQLVLVDMDTLKTLPGRELHAGLAEVIKHGLIRDAEFFGWLEANLERLLARKPEALEHAVLRSIAIKAAIVAEDERESGPRALLNFGHTFGHAIETGSGYGAWLHGEAVAAGMVMAADLSRQLGYLSEADTQRIRSLVQRASLPIEAKGISPQRMLELMSVDKKARDGSIRFVLLERIGSAIVRADVSPAAVDQALSRLAAWAE
jgi:3-dehydroquinate synthase